MKCFDTHTQCHMALKDVIEWYKKLVGCLYVNALYGAILGIDFLKNNLQKMHPGYLCAWLTELNPVILNLFIHRQLNRGDIPD